MTEEILPSLASKIKDLTLIPSSGGVFEVTVDGKTLFSKKEQNRFPTKGEVLTAIKELPAAP